MPPSAYPAFLDLYFDLFDAKGNRPDQFGDRGGEYRSVIGLPGGVKSELYKAVVAANRGRMELKEGRGDDDDARGAVWVYDSEVFPAHRAENYHQFHDGFARGEDYPSSYNNIKNVLDADGALPDTGCPLL